MSPGSLPVGLATHVADLPTALPLELLALGVARVIVRGDACPDCAPTLGAWRDLAAALGLDALVVADAAPDPATTAVAPVVPAAALPTVSRRGLLGLATPNADPNADPDAGPPPPAPDATPHQRLRAAVRALAAPTSDTADRPGPGLLLAAPDCDLAGVCVRVCPEDALTIQRRGSTARLLLDPGACSGCRTCLVACPSGALAAVAHAGWRSLRSEAPTLVASVTTRTCGRCQAPFSDRGGDDLCPACRFRRDHPFGSALPDEVRARLRARR